MCSNGPTNVAARWSRRIVGGLLAAVVAAAGVTVAAPPAHAFDMSQLDWFTFNDNGDQQITTGPNSVIYLDYGLIHYN